MNKLLEMLLIGAVKSRMPGVAKAYDKYEKYAVPLIRARRYYGHNKKKGQDKVTAATNAATDAGVPIHLLLDYLKDKTGDFGDIAVSAVTGTSYDPDKAFKMKF